MEHGIKRIGAVSVGTILLLSLGFSFLYEDLSFFQFLAAPPEMLVVTEKITFGHVVVLAGPIIGLLDFFSARA